MSINNQFLDFNKDKLYYYSPYNVFRKVQKELLLQELIYPQLLDEKIEVIQIKVKEYDHLFFLKYLRWDSEFNGFSTHKLLTCLYIHTSDQILSIAISKFMKEFFTSNKYCFAEIPSEDISFLQALNSNSFRLVETRLTHYLEDIENYKFKRASVRLATKKDIPILKEVASKSVNRYDRLHADFSIPKNLADKYLATYIENAVNGYLDAVLVPNIDKEPRAFMALSLQNNDSKKINYNIARLQLAAVDRTLKGWYVKLASEAVYYAKANGAESVIVTTQSTNRPAFHSTEKQGFKLGGVTHILTYSNII